MTRDELLYHQQALAAAGYPAAALVLIAESDREWRIRRRCERAIARALFPADARPLLAARPDDPERVEAASVGRIDLAPADEDNNDAGTGVARTLARAKDAVIRAAELSAVESRIASAILSHYNRRTGRCDPGLEAIGRAANTSARTARRMVKRLAALGLFAVDQHRGYRHANAYRPLWSRLLGLAPVHVTGAGNAANLAPLAQSGQIDAANAATADPQTIESNPEPMVTGGNSGRGAWDPKRLAGQSVGREPYQISLPLPIAGGRAPADRIEAAIRGKYRDHDARKTYLAAWWALGDAERAGFRGNLSAFETWLRAQGPTAGQGTGRDRRAGEGEDGAHAGVRGNGTQSGRPLGRSVGKEGTG